MVGDGLWMGCRFTGIDTCGFAACLRHVCGLLITAWLRPGYNLFKTYLQRIYIVTTQLRHIQLLLTTIIFTGVIVLTIILNNSDLRTPCMLDFCFI